MVRCPNRNWMKTKGIWWAHLDSSWGPTDYETAEQGPFFDRKLKNSKTFSLAKSPNLTEIEPVPNLVWSGCFTEPCKWKNPNGFLVTEQRTKAEPDPGANISTEVVI